MLLLTRLLVTLVSILEQNVWHRIPGRDRKQDGGAWKDRETDQGLLLANYSHYESKDVQREARMVNILQLCLSQNIWVAETV